MAFDIRRPTPYEKRGDQIVPMTPTHYVTLFQGIERRDADGKCIVVNGRQMYDTQRLYVAEGAVYTDERTRLSMDTVEKTYPWFWEAYGRIDPATRRVVKLTLPEEAVTSAEELDDTFLSTWENLPEHVRSQLAAQYAPQPTNEKVWTCPDCHEEVSTKKKGLHIAKYCPAKGSSGE